MGKVYKRKRRSCGLCKPHKVGWQPRYKHKEMKQREMIEKQMREAKQK